MALVRLLPAFKDYLWGGTKLKENYNKKTDLDIVAESWELSTHKDGQSIVDSGEYKGLTLSEYVEKLGKDALGTKGNAFEFFPILIKFIDAKGNLSIQVHPDNEYALRVEKEYGKTEMWYILDAEEGASLYYGTNKEITKDEFRARIEDNTILDVLKKVPVHKGDVFFIESGTIHAIGEGIVICEIQQNSNTTYRFYDYHRKDANGRERELHIDKSFDVADFGLHCNKVASPFTDADTTQEKLLVDRREFSVRLVDVAGSYVLPQDEKRFYCLSNVSADCVLRYQGEELPFAFTENIFVPAGCADIEICGKARILVSFVR